MIVFDIETSFYSEDSIVSLKTTNQSNAKDALAKHKELLLKTYKDEDICKNATIAIYSWGSAGSAWYMQNAFRFNNFKEAEIAMGLI